MSVYESRNYLYILVVFIRDLFYADYGDDGILGVVDCHCAQCPLSNGGNACYVSLGEHN